MFHMEKLWIMYLKLILDFAVSNQLINDLLILTIQKELTANTDRSKYENIWCLSEKISHMFVLQPQSAYHDE